MVRIAILAAGLLACAAALAQNYGGTFTTKNQQGGDVTLALKQDKQGRVTGTFAGNGATFNVEGVATPQGLTGKVTGPQGTLYLAAKLQGGNLSVILAEPGPNGQPNLQEARQLLFARAGSAAVPKGSPSGNSSDGQLTALLTRNAWCGFTYNKNTGTSRTERVVFHGNGTVVQSTGAQTYNSGPAGSVAGQSAGGNQGRWKVQGGMLQLSQDGVNWTPQPLQVTQNSNGYPIIKSGGKEYMQCN